MSVSQMTIYNSICNGALIPVKDFQISSTPTGLGMFRNSVLWPLFDDVMNKLIPSGIIHHIPNLYDYLMYDKYCYLPKKVPRILTFQDLAFGFALWLTACGISIIVFVAEHLGINIIRKSTFGLGWIGDFIGLKYLLCLLENRMKEIK